MYYGKYQTFCLKKEILFFYLSIFCVLLKIPHYDTTVGTELLRAHRRSEMPPRGGLRQEVIASRTE